MTGIESRKCSLVKSTFQTNATVHVLFAFFSFSLNLCTSFLLVSDSLNLIIGDWNCKEV